MFSKVYRICAQIFRSANFNREKVLHLTCSIIFLIMIYDLKFVQINFEEEEEIQVT